MRGREWRLLALSWQVPRLFGHTLDLAEPTSAARSERAKEGKGVALLSVLSGRSFPLVIHSLRSLIMYKGA